MHTHEAHKAKSAYHKMETLLHTTAHKRESSPSLKKMEDRLQQWRYTTVPGSHTPKVMYTDLDCCSVNGASKYQLLCEALEVRLGVYMRRPTGPEGV